jgi:hypothetical protein
MERKIGKRFLEVSLAVKPWWLFPSTGPGGILIAVDFSG